MGGNLTLRAMVISKDIKAGVIWGGAVAPYPMMMTRWTRRAPPELFRRISGARRQGADRKVRHIRTEPSLLGLDLTQYLRERHIRPVQLHHSTTDEEVPQLSLTRWIKN